MSLAMKSILHVYLDYKNNYEVVLSRADGIVYWLKYNKEVLPRYEKIKRLCNLFQIIWVFFFLIFVALFIFKEMQGK
jgi:hypothetical protein